MIFKTNVKFDLDKLVDGLSMVEQHFDHMNQLAVTFDASRILKNNEPHLSAIGKCPPDIDEWILDNVCPIFQNTYYEEILNLIPYKRQRVRIMRMMPRTTYSMHVDAYKRLHWALITDRTCHMAFHVADKFFGYHIPANGIGYITDTTKFHTAVNPSDIIRYHLVVDIKA